MILRPVAGALLVVLVACSQGEGSDSAASTVAITTTTTATTTVADYVATVEELLADTEAMIASTPEDSSNGYGYLTVASAYTALAEELEEMEPPPDLRLQHRVVIAESEMIAEEAERIADMSDPFDRTGPGVALAAREDALRETVESLTP